MRVVGLIDLDCFYCQCEHVRLGIPSSTPLAVLQWNGLIAVNYAARAAGVKRMALAADAKKLCPELVLIHVDVIDHQGRTIQFNQHSKEFPDQALSKVSLQRYRIESMKIMSIFHEFCSIMERASVDEAFLDLSELCFSTCSQYPCVFEGKVLQEEHGSLEIDTEAKKALAIGSQIVASIRKQVYDTLGYTCSAGIAQNKMIAKVISSFNKPNGQTVCPPEYVSRLMSTVSLTSLRGFGGKMGTTIVNLLPAEVIGENRVISPALIKTYSSLADFERIFGAKNAAYIWDCLSGIDDDQVLARARIKSIVAAKQFPLTKDIESVLKWLMLLSSEIYERVSFDSQEFSREPKSLTIHVASVSRVCTYPSPCKSADEIFKQAQSLLDKAGGRSILPLSYLSLTASNFTDTVDASKQITSFFNLETETEKKAVEENSNEELHCRFCGEPFTSSSERMAHEDFHFAQELQDIEVSKAKVRMKPITPKSKSKKKKSESVSSSKSLKDFFQVQKTM